MNLVWFQNNLRVNDNTSLAEASKNGKDIIAVYCFNPHHYKQTKWGFKKTEKYRTQFLLESIQTLKQNLSKYGIPLFTYFQTPETAISEIVENYGIQEIFAQKEWTSEEAAIEKSVKEKISSSIKWNYSYDQFLFHPDDINFDIDRTPAVFTAFRKKLEKYVDIRPSSTIDANYSQNEILNSTKIATLKDLGFESFSVPEKTAFPFEGGETAAWNRLGTYFWDTNKLSFYKKTRNGLIGKDYSSKFSAWLANGSISARSIYSEVKRYEKKVQKNDSTYWLIFELIWRDYFKYISLKHDNQIFKLEGILKKDYEWSTDSHLVSQWINGETGKPFVDANMIELKETGWMSNRGRQNVASYFAKELKLDWRIGAAYFESILIDYDVHSNYGNWLYVAGVGNDPRDRKFNVDLQAERYDSNGKFQRLWLQPTLF